MSQEAFLQAIIENPDDDAPRLLYADWLDEHGHAPRAEFIRVQCRLAALDQDDPDCRALRRREYELLADHWGEWARPLVGQARRWQFRRGFVEQVKLEAGQFLNDAPQLLDFAPIQELHLKYPEPGEVRALAASKHLRRITRLDLDHAKLGDAGAAVLSGSANLGRLAQLSLRFTGIKTAGLLALAQSPHLKSLRSLDLTGNDLTADDFRTFYSACQLPLDQLEWHDAIGAEGLRALASSPLAGRLTAFTLRDGQIGGEGLRFILESPAFAELRELAVWRDPVLADDGLTELPRSARLPALRRLNLSANKIGPSGAKALSQSPLCDSLTRLDLAYNPIGDSGLNALASSPRLGRLQMLNLAGCNVTPKGAKALLSSPYLDRLTTLGLEGNDVGRKAFGSLRERLGERLYHERFDEGLESPEIARRVKAEPPRCLCGLGARTDTKLIRRFPRDRLDPLDYACVAFELTHPDPAQKAVLLGYEDTRPEYDIFFSPYAIRWEPSGEQREFFDAEQHGRSGEDDFNCTMTGSGERKPWTCGRSGCQNHAFIATFIYRIEYPPTRRAHRFLPFADQFCHIDLAAYCASQDRVIEIASFECK